MLLVLFPSAGLLEEEPRERLLKAFLGRFRWVSWWVDCPAAGFRPLQRQTGVAGSLGALLDVSYRQNCLALAIFAIVFCLTIPLKIFNRLRERRKQWLYAAFGLAMFVILISAYLRRG